MALVIPDLKQAVTLGGVSLNNVSLIQSGGKEVLSGNRVDYMNVAPADVVQYTEKLVLANGLDYGPVYLGGRLIEIRGVSFAATRGQAYDAVSAIEAVATPVSGGFGIIALTFKAVTGAGGSSSSKSVNVRPNGISVPVSRDTFGGDNTDPVGIPWAITALAMNPAIA